MTTWSLLFTLQSRVRTMLLDFWLAADDNRKELVAKDLLTSAHFNKDSDRED